jgi:hypothetical protein
MIGRRFIQAVEPNDLILIYPAIPYPGQRDSATMFVVLCAPADGDPHPLTSSITVREIDWRVPALSGNWILDGLYIDNIPVNSEEDPDFFELDDLPETEEAGSLKDILDMHEPEATPDGDQGCLRVWVNPH